MGVLPGLTLMAISTARPGTSRRRRVDAFTLLRSTKAVRICRLFYMFRLMVAQRGAVVCLLLQALVLQNARTNHPVLELQFDRELQRSLSARTAVWPEQPMVVIIGRASIQRRITQPAVCGTPSPYRMAEPTRAEMMD